MKGYAYFFTNYHVGDAFFHEMREGMDTYDNSKHVLIFVYYWFGNLFRGGCMLKGLNIVLLIGSG